MAKVEYIKFNEFMDGSWKLPKVKRSMMLPTILGGSTLGVAASMMVNKVTALASTISSQGVYPGIPVSTDIQGKVANAFDPLFALMGGLAYPLCFLTISGGCVLIMIGQKHKGIHLIKWAAIGFIGLQFAPGIMQILMQVAAAMKQ